MKTKTSAASAITDRQIAETCDAVEAAYDAGRFLTAHKTAVAEFGADLFAWPGDLGRVWAVRMASRLGGYQLSNALQFGLARRGPASAEGIYAVTSFQLGRKPLARFWLDIKDRDLATDDARLAARWLTLKARIMAGVRDFDRSTALMDAATLIRRERHAEAAELIDQVERFFPLIDPINKIRRRAKRGSLLSQIASLRSDAFVEQGNAPEAIRWAGRGLAKRLQNPRMSSREGLGV